MPVLLKFATISLEIESKICQKFAVKKFTKTFVKKIIKQLSICKEIGPKIRQKDLSKNSSGIKVTKKQGIPK